MSQPIASTYVEIRPRVSQNFQGDLQSQVQKDVDAATARIKARVGDARFARLEKQGIIQSFQQTAAVQSQLRVQRELEAAQTAGAAAAGRFGSSIVGTTAKIGLYGLAIGAVYDGTRRLSDALAVTGAQADTLTGSLRNAGAAALKGDIAGFAKQGGQAAALLGGDARAAARAASEATQRETDLQKAIALAAQFVQVREQAAKATGKQGTAEGVVKFQLEQQLKILRLQVAALPKGENRVAFAQLGLGPNGTRNQALIDRTTKPLSGRPTDLDFELQAARAASTKQSQDDLTLFTDRRNYLRRLIDRTEAAGTETESAKNNLKRLYGLLDSADSQVETLRKDAIEKRRQRLQESIALQQTQVQIQAANARSDGQEIAALNASAALSRKFAEDKRLDAQQRAGYQLQAAQADQQIFQINQAAAAAAKQAREEAARVAEQERLDALARLKAARQRKAQTLELSLQNQLARAQLTKGTKDDREALQALAQRYRDLIKNSKGLEREQARAQLIGIRGQLKGLKPDQALQTSTTAQFFAEAARQSTEFGSNIGSRNGSILSGQDARGRFADIALRNRNPTADLTEAINQLGHFSEPALSEAEEQTRLLRKIATGIDKFGKPAAVSDRQAINRARASAVHVGP